MTIQQNQQSAFEPELMQRIALELPAKRLDSARKVKLKNRIIDALAAKPNALTLASEHDYIKILPGVSVRKLQDAHGSMIALWRLAQGACIPDHGHLMDEACLILDGQLEHAGRLMQKGDFLCAAAGEHQQPIVALKPSLLLIRGESRF